MIDINETIKKAEENLGRQLLPEEKKAVEMFGNFVDFIFPKTNNKEIQTEKESKILEINEVIAGLDYCLNEKQCIGCKFGEDRMFATCKPLAENALRLLKKQIPVKPVIKHMTSYPDQKPLNKIVCGACNQWALEDDALYCGNCGQAVKWE